MKGSKKQITWAEKIKEALFNNAEERIRYYEDRKKGLEKQGKSTAGAEKVISRYRLAKVFLEKEENAERIINERGSNIESTVWFREAEKQIPRKGRK